MKPSMKKRLFISCAILVIGVLALQPYLSSKGVDLPHPVSFRPTTANSVANVLQMGSLLIVAADSLPMSGAERASLTVPLNRLERLMKQLKSEIRNQTEGSTDLSASARDAYNALVNELKSFLLRQPAEKLKKND